MATHYLSDHFVAALDFVENGEPRPKYAVPQAVDGGFVHYKRGYASVIDFSGTDTVRLLNIRSSDRLHWMAFSTTGMAMVINLGLWSVGSANDGPAIDVDMFMQDIDINALKQAEALTAGVGFTDEQRGAPLWEVLGLSSDPSLRYDIVADRVFGNDGGEILLEAMFTREGS